MLFGKVPFGESSLGQQPFKAQLSIDRILIWPKFQTGCYSDSPELGFQCLCDKKICGPFICVVIKLAGQAELCLPNS